MTAALDRLRSREFALRGLVVGLIGLFIAGIVGAIVGYLAGGVARTRPRTVLIAAAGALLLAAVYTVFEEPLKEATVPTFPDDHPAAQLAGKVAAVLLLAGLAGIVARRGIAPRTDAAPAGGAERGGASWAPALAQAPVLVATLIGAVALGRLGDRSWDGLAVGLAVAVVLAAAGLAFARHRRGLRTGSP